MLPMPFFLDPQSNLWTYAAPKHAHVRVAKGQREATAADFNFRDTKPKHMWLADVGGERIAPAMACPVLLVGRGPSCGATLKGAHAVAVNPHAATVYGQRIDACFSGDRDYWKEHHFAWRARNPDTLSVWLTNPDSEKYKFWRVKHKQPSRAVCMGEWPLDRCNTNHWPVVLRKGTPRILAATPPAALLYALQITTGPVVLAGFDLSGTNAQGTNYKANQFWKWEAIAGLVDRARVQCHSSMGGPVRGLFDG